MKNNLIHKEICQHGYHFGPFISDRGHIQWRISTSYLEAQIFWKSIIQENHKNCQKQERPVPVFKIPKDCLLNQKPAGVLKFYNFSEEKDYDENFWKLVSLFL